MKLAAALLALLATPFAPAPAQSAGAPSNGAARWRVEVQNQDGELYCTVRADQDSLLEVLREIARQAELTLDGVQGSWRKTLVSADLQRRPLRQALTFLLGGVGLHGEVRQGAIYLREGVEDSNDRDELLESSLASYLRVLRDFPDHALADDAVRSQAVIEEMRRRPAAARAHFESLIERYPNSELVAEAMFRSGTLLMRTGAWQDAAQRLSDLLRLEVQHAYEAPARLELAFCVAQLGEFERALYMVDALEGIAPPADADEERRRAYVRIRAMAGLGQGKQALALLDDVDRRLGFATTKRESLALRASASESAGLSEDAARAWLSYGRMCEEPERSRAFTRAAKLAVEGGDELAALFIAQFARRQGVDLAEIARDARQRLALDEVDQGATNTLQRLARAERLLEANLRAEALRSLQVLESSVALLPETDRLRFSRAYARVLDSELGVDAALSHLRAVVPDFQEPASRRELYLLAGELLEDSGRIADAIEAYRGRI